MRLPTLPGWDAPAFSAASSSASSAARSMLAALLVLGSSVVTPPAAIAKTDGAAIGKCLLKNCQIPLAKCVANPVCAANLLCIQTCTGRADEGDCQIRCGDAFSNDVVGDFTKCAVSDKKCVPQRADDGSWPVPSKEALVASFSPDMLTGPWYISAGYNKAFDTFDCQLHKFESPADNKLVGNLQWRIKDPVAGTNFVTRYTVQEFVQDKESPGILYNHDNEFLHYQDDWYVLAAKPEEYVLVYYRGENDAWVGYGGAVVYTRDPVFPRKYAKDMDVALQKVGLKFADFTLTDNSCRAAESKIEEAAADLVYVESKVAGGIQSVESGALNELTKDVKLLEAEIEMIGSTVGTELVVLEKEIEKDVVAIEGEVLKDERAVVDFFGGLLKKK